MYALKIYPSHSLDKRDRLLVEFDSLDFLNRNGVTNTPKTFKKSKELNIALYEWIDGSISPKVLENEVIDALGFIKTLKHLSKSKANSPKQLASESCLSITELSQQIDRRLAKLNDIKGELDLQNFLNSEFKPLFDELNLRIKLLQKRLLTVRASENVVRLLPPLNVTKKEINLALKILNDVCENY